MLNVISSLTLKNYIRTFDKVAYDNQLEPYIGEDGHYTFKTDGDFKIMQLNDLHIAGGHWSLKKDKKTIYEVCTMVQVDKPDLIILNGDSGMSRTYIFQIWNLRLYQLSYATK